MKRFTLAAIVLAAAACDGSSSGPDPSTVVTVLARDGLDRPVAGANAYGHDPAGLLVDTQLTDTDGEAVLLIPAGGSVTLHNVVDPNTAAWRTVLAVVPGDALTVRIPAAGDYEVFQPPAHTIAVTLPPMPAGATNVVVQSPCAYGHANDDATVSLGVSCTAPTTVVATAYTGLGEVVAYLVLSDIDLQPLTTLAPAAAWAAPTEHWTVEVTNVPAGVRYVTADRYLGDQYAGHHDHGGASGLTTGGRATIEAPRPTAAGSVLYALYTGPWNGGYRNSLVTNQDVGDLLAFDLGALLQSTELEVIDDGRALHWTPVAGADMFAVNYEVASGSGDVIGPMSGWSVVAPPSVTSFTFPTDVGFPFPGTTQPSNRIYGVGVRAWDNSWWTSYDQVRQDAGAEHPADYTSSSSYDGFSIYNPET